MLPLLVLAFHFRLSDAHLVRITVLSTVLVCSIPALAQQPFGKGGSEESGWGLGLAIMGRPGVYKGVDRETRVLPMLSYENRYVKLSGPNVELKLPGLQMSESQRLNFGFVAKLFGSGGYEASDSYALTGMAERKSSAWVGPKVEWENDLADVKLEVLGDASGGSKGRRVVLILQHKWMLSSKIMLIPQVGVEWVDKKYVDYYYGVRASEARVGRSAYMGESTVNPEISLTGIYRFDKQQSLMLNVGVKFLGKEIKSSPIVGRSIENRLMLGYQYSF